VFTPDAHRLSNRAKILTYLVALQGWPFVLDEIVPVDAKPAEIEAQTGIPGGSLRPTLKELKDRNVITEKGGRYSVRAVALRKIQAELNGDTGSTRPVLRGRRKPEKASDDLNQTGNDQGPEGNARSRKAASIGVAQRFQSWIDEGYFDQARALSDVQQRFHKEAIIVPQTSLPTYLLKGVRSGQLVRDREEVNGKLIWVYSRKKK
jgi:hypothetical protein